MEKNNQGKRTQFERYKGLSISLPDAPTPSTRVHFMNIALVAEAGKRGSVMMVAVGVSPDSSDHVRGFFVAF